ncbi:unnamed protein product [Leptidea sinapis]|uniref:Uncharacterized protein n=1 Tax=Leptidea sinapis TaxID=189913 RepID=A0A5E4QBW3_9NEOP|nr:unnamed protein product [Leptidea sinapis]
MFKSAMDNNTIMVPNKMINNETAWEHSVRDLSCEIFFAYSGTALRRFSDGVFALQNSITHDGHEYWSIVWRDYNMFV